MLFETLSWPSTAQPAALWNTINKNLFVTTALTVIESLAHVWTCWLSQKASLIDSATLTWKGFLAWLCSKPVFFNWGFDVCVCVCVNTVVRACYWLTLPQVWFPKFLNSQAVRKVATLWRRSKHPKTAPVTQIKRQITLIVSVQRLYIIKLNMCYM